MLGAYLGLLINQLVACLADHDYNRGSEIKVCEFLFKGTPKQASAFLLGSLENHTKTCTNSEKLRHTQVPMKSSLPGVAF